MKIVAICSGGLDSTILYYKLISEGHRVLPVNFYYGSKHNKIERSRAENLIPELVEINIDLSFLNSSLLNKEIVVPHGHYAEESMKSTVVPFRNGIMLSYAIAIAEDRNFEAVALGSHAGDHAIYPDCRPEFTENISSAGISGTYNHIRVISPFNLLTKGQIVEVGRDLGIFDIMGSTWSCYEGDTLHCGKCGSCTERKEAFASAGVIDLTQYRN